MKTRKAFENLLNETGCPEHDRPDNGGRCPKTSVDKYGKWLRKNDPIAFSVGFSEFEEGE